MTKNDITRIDYLDQLKGFGIVLVVVGHFIEPYREIFPIINSIFICIYSFHMPLFCMISGIVGKFNGKKLLFKMGWLYVVAQSLYLSCCVILHNEYFIEGGAKRFIRQFLCPYWHMWYLYALIFWLLSLVLIDWVKKYISRIVILFGYMGIMLGSGYIHLPLELTRVVVFYIFFLAGYLYKDALLQWIKEKRDMVYYLPEFIVLMALFIVIALVAEYVNANILWEYLSYSEGGYNLWERIIFCMVAMAICLLIYRINMLYKSSVLINLGKNTMPIYIFHAVFVKGCDILEMHINAQQSAQCVLGRLVAAVIVIFILQSSFIKKITSKVWNIFIDRLG